MNEETEPRKSRSHRSQHRLGRNRQKIEQLRKAVLWVLSILVVVVVVLLLNPRSERGGNQGLNPSGLTDRNTQTPDFDLVIRDGDVAQLVDFSNNLLIDQSEHEVTQLDAIGKRMAISDRILELNPDADSQTFAILTKLKMLLDREQLLVDKGMHSDVRVVELQEYARKYVSFDEESIAGLALVGVAVAAISDYLDSDTTAERAEMMTAALEKFTTAAQSSADDPAIATRLYDWLKIVQKRGEKQDSHPFSVAWANCYADSQDSRISSLFDRMANISELSEVDFVNVVDSMPSNRDPIIGQLLEQIDGALNQSDVSDATIQFALKRASDLLALGKSAEAIEIRSRIAKRLSEPPIQIRQQLAIFNSHAKLFETEFSLKGLTDLNDQPAEFRFENAEYKLLYFVSPMNYGEAVLQFRDVLKMFRDDIISSRIELTIVYINDPPNEKAQNDIRVLGANDNDWQVWSVKPKTEDGLAFMQQIPGLQTPFIIIVGRDGKVTQLDPQLRTLEELR